ncbi:MAG TPA: helix-turn-helix transcriptional regulator [Ohtaekwangia sp.]|uniref:helix-turn-helix domain-containing protein n=1 Tax=Ohtaekwangia sp. TaxID=2066019 RepID=UPI002F91C494
MQRSETLEDFYRRYPNIYPQREGIPHKAVGNFNVYSRESCGKYAPYNRRDYYKISLIIGQGNLHYADKTIEINRNALVFFNPQVPYAWEPTSEKQAGYFCLFTSDFIHAPGNASILESPLFQIGGNPVFFIDKKQESHISMIFQKMLSERDSEYIYKYDLLRNYVNLIIHEALKFRPADSCFIHTTAASRIVTLFVELLERQFPVDSVEHTLKLRTANDYATRLSVHPNHLNRAVREVTGKTTTEHITNRVVQEAKALLMHTDWSVAEIAYCLGFEYPAYFNNFFKKQTNLTPRSLRK